ncbi:MAG: glycosyltransferase, partial [Verrucomicrobiota bacterium]
DDLVLPGKTGARFKAGNVKSLTEALSTLLSNPDNLKSMGLSARQHIAGFSYEAATQGLLNCLRSTSAKRGTSPVIIVPELFRSTGGVQRYSQEMIRALDEIFRFPQRVVSLNDRKSDLPDSFQSGRVVVTLGSFPRPLRKVALSFLLLFARRTSFHLSTHPGPSPALALARHLFGIPFYCVLHGIDAWSLGRLHRRGLRDAEAILPVSHFTKDRVSQQMRHHTPPAQVLPNTVDPERFFPASPGTNWRKRLGLEESSFVVLTVCRLDRSETKKGYDQILESLPALKNEVPSLRWVLAGLGGDLERIKTRAEALGVSDRCRFPGFIEDRELPDLYRSSNLFVLPSEKEGFGIVFLEATATGIGAIGGNIDGSVDALGGGALGKLIDPRDPEELRDAIVRASLEPARDPNALHHACIERFGRAAFRKRLRTLLGSWVPGADSFDRPSLIES